MRGEPNPRQWEMYAQNNCVFQYHLPPALQYMRNWNRDYLAWAQQMGLRRDFDPIVIHIYSEFLQRFRLAAQGKRPGRQPPERLRARVGELLRSAAVLVRAARSARRPTSRRYPLRAVTQRPMAMYHSWDSQNAWLRQIHAHNYLMVNPRTARAAGIADGGWMWVESPWGKVRCMCRYSEAVEPGTVWTWNAIGKASAARGTSPPTPNESQQGLPAQSPDLRGAARGRPRAPRISNSDPITGQAAWYDVRVRIYPAAPASRRRARRSSRRWRRVPGRPRARPAWIAYLRRRDGRAEAA